MAVSLEETLQRKLNDIVCSVQQEEKRLKDEWQAVQVDRAAMEAELKSRTARLEEERATFEAEKKMIVAADAVGNSKVELDVGGPTYQAWQVEAMREPQLGLDSSKNSGVSAVDRHHEVISPSLSGGRAQGPLPIGLLFPDAGTVYVTMMSGVKEIPAVKDMLKKVALILGFDLLSLCLEGPVHKLLEGGNRHCASYVACLAGLEKLRNEREEAVTQAHATAGVGTGEIVALTAAGVFSLEDGLRLAKLSGEALHEACMTGGQSELTVVGLDKTKLVKLCAEAARKEGAGAVCQISCEVSRLAFAAGGTKKSIVELKDLAKKAGALRAQVTSPAADNTPLMKPLEAKLSAILNELLPNMSPPRTTVYMNGTGAPIRPGTNPTDIVKLLKHRTSPLLWGACVERMMQEGISEFYEVGPGASLKNMMRRQNAKTWRRSMTNIAV